MKNLSIALIVGVVLGAALYAAVYLSLALFALTDFTVHAAAVSAIPVSGVPYIADLLERRHAKKSLAPGHTTDVPSLQGYAISWWLMAVYGAIILFAVTQIGSGIGGLIAGAALPFSETMSEGAANIVIFASVIAAIIGAYFVGRWIGARCGSFGIVSVILMAAIATLVTRAIDFLFLSPEEFETVFGFAPSLQEAAVQYFGGVIFLSIIGLIGYWRGRRRRLSKYLNYLFGILPQETRQILVGLAFEEAQAVGAGQRTAHPEALPATAATASA